MKTKIVVSMDYRCVLLLSPDQAAVFVKLIQGADVCTQEGYGEDAKYTVTNKTVEIRNVPESSVIPLETVAQEVVS
jgi:hypothetical protein